MTNQPRPPVNPEDGLVETGTPDDPAKKENPDTSLEQLQPWQQPDGKDPTKPPDDPTAETDSNAGQGTG